MTSPESTEIPDDPAWLERAAIAAERAVRLGAFASRRAGEVLAIDDHLRKDDGSLVTPADLLTQALLVESLDDAVERGEVPRIPMIGEESAPEEDDLAAALDRLLRADGPWNERRGSFDPVAVLARSSEEALAAGAGGRDRPSARAWWVADPIDGTSRYAIGGQYATCLALVVDGVVRVGAVACPRHGDDGLLLVLHPDGRLEARDGLAQDAPPRAVGARPVGRTDAVRIAVPARDDRRTRAAIDRVVERLETALDRRVETVPIDTQCRYVLTAIGEVHGWARRFASDRPQWTWDHAPGSAFAEAVGVRVTDAHGSPLSFDGGAVLGGRDGVVCAVEPLAGAFASMLLER